MGKGSSPFHAECPSGLLPAKCEQALAVLCCICTWGLLAASLTTHKGRVHVIIESAQRKQEETRPEDDTGAPVSIQDASCCRKQVIFSSLKRQIKRDFIFSQGSHHLLTYYITYPFIMFIIYCLPLLSKM